MSKVIEEPDGRKTPTRKRRYDSTRRAEQAADTRRRVVEAAAACFSDRGYGPTTMAQIARRAGVSTETVNANGPKRALLIAAFSQAFVGEETEDDVTRSDPWAEVLGREEPTALLDGVADLVLEGQASGIRMWRVLSAAAVEEPDVGELYQALAGRRRASLLAATQLLGARGLLRAGNSVEEHADTLALLAGFDPYQLYVLDFGWQPEQLRAWFIRMVRSTVLDLS